MDPAVGVVDTAVEGRRSGAVEAGNCGSSRGKLLEYRREPQAGKTEGYLVADLASVNGGSSLTLTQGEVSGRRVAPGTATVLRQRCCVKFWCSAGQWCIR